MFDTSAMDTVMKTAFDEILDQVALEMPDKERLETIKRRISTKYHLKRFPRNSDLLTYAMETRDDIEDLKKVLRIRNVRSISGVNVISVMTAPFPCRHGACIYCPGGPSWGTPMSYTGREPASMRAIQNGFDPTLQLKSRIKQLEATGHNAEKIDLIVMGGTFNSTPRAYQDEFMLGIYEALNGERSETIEEAKRKNETAKYRCVGLTFETKPDWALKKHIIPMLEYGVTRVEVGVQTLQEDVLRFVNRGHGVKETVESFKALRDAGLKITAHMMPGLPGTTPETDIEDFRTLYYDPRFIPDEIKIYPTQVIENTPLAQMVMEGKYKALTNEETFRIILEAKKMTPPYVRIKRALRDLPINLVVAGATWGDMRKRIQEQMDQLNAVCKCIRCREVGHYIYKGNPPPDPDTIDLRVRSYEASDGMEHFLSYEDPNDVLIGFLRLRFPSNDVYIPELKDSAIVRELHVYGSSLQIGGRDYDSFQHRGYGRKLLTHAEKMAEENGFEFLSIISGVGVRKYYEKFGYKLNRFYMTKKIA